MSKPLIYGSSSTQIDLLKELYGIKKMSNKEWNELSDIEKLDLYDGERPSSGAFLEYAQYPLHHVIKNIEYELYNSEGNE